MTHPKAVYKVLCALLLAVALAVPLGLALSPAALAGPPLQEDEAAEEVTHPLDPLTPAEYEQVLELLAAEELVDEGSMYPIITLQEPAKELVLAWEEGDDIPRAAFAIVKQGEQTFEAVVNLTAGEVESWEEIEGVQASILLTEFFGAQEIVLANEEFQEALALRGVEDFENLACAPLSVGYYGLPEEEGRRLLRVPCFYMDGNNPFAKPIEGLYGLVDLNTQEVIDILDTGVRPLPENNYDLDEGSVDNVRAPLNTTVFTQPDGANFTVDGHIIEWEGWRFHQRLDKRTGLVISDVSFQEEGGEARPILYQGSLSEVFVPYQDPDAGFYWRTFMDAGEYGFGLFATPLVPGIDCPETATYLNANLSFDDGSLLPYEGVICVFERPTGNPMWRHFEGFNGVYEGRPSIDLVVRTISTVGNYDYVVDWIFTQDARIRVAVGATGIDLPKGVVTTSMSDTTAITDTAYGTLVAPNIVAPYHSHYFSFRLDMDVDGTDNSFMITELTPTETPDSPRAGIWTVESRMAMTESDAQLDVNPIEPKMYHVMNENKTGELGHSPSYMLMPKNSFSYSLMPDEDPAVQRAYFIQNHVWITPYAPEEQNAAGLYVNQSQGGDGLPEWTSADRSIMNTDIVMWYTVGFHHVTQTEDWPVMSIHWFYFELMPYNFFEQNPAMNLPNPAPLANN